MKDIVREGLSWRIGDGAKVRIWEDKWLPTLSTYLVQSPPKFLGANAKVREIIDQNLHCWNIPLIEAIFNQTDCRAIKAIPISLTNQPNVQVWRGTQNGIFSVSSAYHFVKEMEELRQPECSLRSGDSTLWKEIWTLPITNAGKNFIWRACQNLLPTKENLMKRRVVNDPMCPICSFGGRNYLPYFMGVSFGLGWGGGGEVLGCSKRV